MSVSSAENATAHYMRDYSGDLDALKRNKFIVEKQQRENGEIPATFDTEAVAKNAKKYSDMGQDITEMNFEDWLKLTVTSFQNQDPLNPKDPGSVATEFATIGMTMGFSKVREDVDKMLGVMNKGMSMSASGKVGQQIEAQFNTFKYNGEDPVKLGFDLPFSAHKVKVEITDENANFVHAIILEDGEKTTVNGKEEITDLALGRNDIYWSGLKKDGTPFESGKYSFKVRAYEANGDEIKDPNTDKPYQIRRYVTGILEASYIDSNNNPKVQMDGIEMPFDAIKKMSAAPKKNEAAKEPEVEYPLPNDPEVSKPKYDQERWDRTIDPLMMRYAQQKASAEDIRKDFDDVLKRYNLD